MAGPLENGGKTAILKGNFLLLRPAGGDKLQMEWINMERTTIAAIFADQQTLGGQTVTVCGWAG